MGKTSLTNRSEGGSKLGLKDLKHVAPVVTTGDIAKTKQKDEVLDTPVYIIAMEESTKDAQRVAEMLEKMVRLHGSEPVRKNVHITPGMNVAAWPAKIELAEYALKCVIAKRSKQEIASLPWIETYASRNDKGQLANPSAREFPMSHHIGCLYAHMYDWQMAQDAGYKTTILFESDAVDPSLLGVPLSAIQSIVNEAPKDFDLIFLTKRPVGGKMAKKFMDPLGNKIHLYHLTEQNEEAGLSSYIISDSFFKKMQRYIIKHGADMVDAWLSAKMCVKPAFDKHGNFVSFEGGGQYRYLNCYHAATPGFRSKVSDNFPL